MKTSPSSVACPHRASFLLLGKLGLTDHPSLTSLPTHCCHPCHQPPYANTAGFSRVLAMAVLSVFLECLLLPEELLDIFQEAAQASLLCDSLWRVPPPRQTQSRPAHTLPQHPASLPLQHCVIITHFRVCLPPGRDVGRARAVLASVFLASNGGLARAGLRDLLLQESTLSIPASCPPAVLLTGPLALVLFLLVPSHDGSQRRTTGGLLRFPQSTLPPSVSPYCRVRHPAQQAVNLVPAAD